MGADVPNKGHSKITIFKIEMHDWTEYHRRIRIQSRKADTTAS